MQWGAIANGLAIAGSWRQHNDATQTSIAPERDGADQLHLAGRRTVIGVVAGSIPVLVASVAEAEAACSGPILRDSLAFVVIDPGISTVRRLMGIAGHRSCRNGMLQAWPKHATHYARRCRLVDDLELAVPPTAIKRGVYPVCWHFGRLASSRGGAAAPSGVQNQSIYPVANRYIWRANGQVLPRFALSAHHAAAAPGMAAWRASQCPRPRCRLHSRLDTTKTPVHSKKPHTHRVSSLSCGALPHGARLWCAGCCERPVQRAAPISLATSSNGLIHWQSVVNCACACVGQLQASR